MDALQCLDLVPQPRPLLLPSSSSQVSTWAPYAKIPSVALMSLILPFFVLALKGAVILCYPRLKAIKDGRGYAASKVAN